VISQVTFKVAGTAPDDKAARKGFTTFRKAEKGVWEKVGGEGPDILAGTKEDIAAVEAEKTPKRQVLDLDQDLS
jgi:Holliday junction resolvase